MTDAGFQLFAIAAAAVFGSLIGSFLNVVVWRVPRGLSVVSPPSACPGCGHGIAWYDNIPILSYLLLGGRCRRCGAGISGRYPLVELGTAVTFALAVAGALAGVFPVSLLPLVLYWVAVGIALALIDLEHHRLPDGLTLPSVVVTAVLLVAASAFDGEPGRLLPAAVGLVALGGLYLLLAIGYRGGMGLGDVKLALGLGPLLGWLGWAPLIVGGFSAFVFGGVVGIVLMAAGRAGRRSGIPFGPFMLGGAAFGVVAGPAVAALYLSLAGLA